MRGGSMSKLEERIVKILQKEKVKFRREVTFSDLRNGKLRFDFQIERNGTPMLVEIQGEQHYRPVQKFQRTRAEFLQQQGRDRRKISYCLAKRIPLYLIPFWEVDNINTVQDLFKDKYRAKNQWKNNLDWEKFKKI